MRDFHPRPAGHRLWLPLSTGILAALAIAVIRTRPELERNQQSWFTAGVVLLGILLCLIWFFFLSGVRWRSRRLVLLGLVLVGFGVKETLRVEGSINGTGMPKLAWKWTHPPAVQFAVPMGAADVAAGAVPEGLADVPQFFGPHRTGVVQGAKLARDWNATPPKQLWRQPVGAGWSAFAIVGSRAYTQEQRGDEEAVTCYDALSGRPLWVHGHAAHFSQWQGGDGPRATPTVLGDRVFAYGATGILECLDAATGQLVWTHEVLKEHHLENLIWGVSASPLVFEDAVVVTGGLTSGPTVLAYHRVTGALLWQAGTDKASYSSPMLATLAGRSRVLSLNASSLTVHDPASGEVLLDFPWGDDKWPKAAQPVVLEGDRVFLSAGYGLGCVLLEIKAGADGKLAATTLWKNQRMKTQFNSAAPHDGFFYGLDDGLLACVEIRSGERKWKDGRYGSGQSLLVDDLLLIQSEPGPVMLAAAKPEGFAQLGRIPALSAKTWNHPTLAGHYLFVRNDHEAACYELPVEK